MLVRDVLRTKTTGVISIGSEAKVEDAVARLVQNNIGSLPIVDPQGRLIGVLSERDVLRGLHQRGESFAKAAVGDVMTTNPVTCAPDDDVNDVMGQMSERHIAKVPVLNDGRLVGIISVGDVIKVQYESLHSEHQHLMTYIHGSY